MGDLLSQLGNVSPYAAYLVIVGTAVGWLIKRRDTNARSEQDEQATERVAGQADSATTQATLLAAWKEERTQGQVALRDERALNAVKDRRIDELEAEVGTLRDQLYAQRDEYEIKLGDLHRRVRDLTFQIEDLQHRLRPAD